MIVLFVLLAILLGVLVGSYAAYRKTFYQDRRIKEDIYRLPKHTDQEIAARTHALIAAFDAREFESVEIRSHDGLRLFARYYHAFDGAPLHIQFHGYRSYAMRDFCGGNPLAVECGHNTLVVDQRAHGRSEGHTISFGVKERLDCLAWVEYATRRFGRDVPIFLSGVSMGASTVLMATALPLPKNVVGVIADCPYSSPRRIIQKVMRDMGLPVFIYPLVALGGFLYGGIRGLSRYTAEDAVRFAKVPILLIHGDADGFVPCDMSHAIAKACASRICFEVFPDADHAQSYMSDYDRYRRISHEFIKECLNDYQNKED